MLYKSRFLSFTFCNSGKMNKNQLVKIEEPSHKRPRNPTTNFTNFRSCKPKTLPKQACNFFEPDNDSDDAHTTVIEVSFAHARATLDEKQVACYFGSALCAFCPELTTSVKNALGEHAITLTVIKVPPRAYPAAINLDGVGRYDSTEILTLIGSCLILLFKNVSQVNYNNFISKRVCALGGKIGLPKKTIEALKLPLVFRQAKAVRDVLGSNGKLKQEVREYLKWLADAEEGIYSSMACYVCLFCIPPKPPSMTYDEAIRLLTSDVLISTFRDDEDET